MNSVTDPVLDRYARRATPRYTSYPTAPHFQKGFAEARYRDWLSKLDVREPVSLYLHVPFCRQMCWYCGCNMKLASRYGPVGDYAQMLRKEVALTAEALPGRMTISHLHWGGGTPTALSPDDLEDLMNDVRKSWDFAEDAEIAIESDPRTLTAEMAARIGALGFTRASFGVQEFDIRVQKAINRVQPPDMVRRSVDQLRAAGVTGINFDLIYGLPYQTVDSLVETVRLSVAMRPDRVALFGYAHVPWMAKNQRMIPDASLPGAEERAAQAEAAAQALLAEGYVAIGLDHFALPEDGLAVAARAGTLRRNFQGYTTDQAETLIGMGATSIGRTPSGYLQNIAETGAWARAVSEGHLPVAKGLPFVEDDCLRAEVIERLMCDGHVDAQAIGLRHDAPEGWWAEAFHRLEEMQTDGLLTLSGGQVRMTPRGRPLVRIAAAAFDAYLQDSTARHSVAV
jgi:oxygen-independent coproporphyrinogen-3 oxidase